MKNIVFVLGFLAVIAVLAVGLLTGCQMGNHNVTSQERTVEDFNGITLTGVGDVYVHPGESKRVIVTTDSNLQGRVVTTVSGNTLRISQRSGSFTSTELTIDVYLPELSEITLTGVGDFKIYAGEADNLDISLSGTGDIDAQSFQVQNIYITQSGVGTSKVWAVDTLRGSLSGVGSILYKGSPTVNINRTGVGSIRPL